MMTNPKISRTHATASIGLVLLIASGLATAQIDPPSVTDTLPPGASMGVAKTVTTPEIPPNPDIVFLSDTTGSMSVPINDVQANAANILSTILAGEDNTQFAVAEYRDAGSEFGPASGNYDCKLNQQLTSDTAAVTAGINAWSASGGGDDPEGQMAALTQIASGGACEVNFRPDSTSVIVWFGDQPGKDPTATGGTLASAIDALSSIEAQVVALSVGVDNLDSTGQVTTILGDPDIGGSFTSHVNPDNVADEILEALSNLPITVTPTPTCDAGLSATFAPASSTVTSGGNANFAETIAVAGDPSLAGTTLGCVVEFIDDNGTSIGSQTITIEVPIAIDLDPDTATNELGFDLEHVVTATVTSGPVPIPNRTVSYTVTGQNAGEAGTAVNPTDASGQGTFTYGPPVEPDSLGTDTIEGCLDEPNTDVCDQVEKIWEDTTPPTASCDPTVNPHGNKEPQAPGKGGQGVNQDGYYIVTAEDVVWPEDSLEIWISGFGPFASGDNVKITEDPDATEESKKMGSGKGSAGAIAAHLILNADAVVTAVDGSGNTSEPVVCLVPPAPK